MSPYGWEEKGIGGSQMATKNSMKDNRK